MRGLSLLFPIPSVFTALDIQYRP